MAVTQSGIDNNFHHDGAKREKIPTRTSDGLEKIALIVNTTIIVNGAIKLM